MLPYFLNWNETLKPCYAEWAKWKIESSSTLQNEIEVKSPSSGNILGWWLGLEDIQCIYCKLLISHSSGMCFFLSKCDHWLPFWYNFFNACESASQSFFWDELMNILLWYLWWFQTWHAEIVTSYAFLFWRPFNRFA